MTPVQELLNRLVVHIVNPAIKGLFVLALLFFLWGVVEFIRNSDSDDGRTKGKQHMFWGVIGMSIMVGVNTIIYIALGTLQSIAR